MKEADEKGTRKEKINTKKPVFRFFARPCSCCASPHYTMIEQQTHIDSLENKNNEKKKKMKDRQDRPYNNAKKKIRAHSPGRLPCKAPCANRYWHGHSGARSKCVFCHFFYYYYRSVISFRRRSHVIARGQRAMPRAAQTVREGEHTPGRNAGGGGGTGHGT